MTILIWCNKHQGDEYSRPWLRQRHVFERQRELWHELWWCRYHEQTWLLPCNTSYQGCQGPTCLVVWKPRLLPLFMADGPGLSHNSWYVISYSYHNWIDSNKCVSASSVAVECIFSKGHLVVTHTHNHLSPWSIQAILCLGKWSTAGYVHKSDLTHAALLPEPQDVDSDDDGWSDNNW